MSENLPTQRAEPFLAFVQRALADESFDTQKFEVLLDRYERMQEREAAREFNEAVAAIQSELSVIAKDKSNPAFASRYATLEALWREAAPAVSKYGVSIRFGSAPGPREDWLRVTCTLSKGRHQEVHYLDGPIVSSGARGGRMAMTDIQAVGSTATYLRRYLLMMVLNLVQADDPADDDGNGSRTSTERTPPPSRREQINTDVPLKTSTPDPEPGESMEDYARRVRGGSPPPPVTAPNGEDKGETIDTRRRRAWIQQHYRRRCDAVTDKEAAANLLKDAQVLAFEARIEGDEALLAEFRQVRQSMVDRIWPPEASPA